MWRVLAIIKCRTKLNFSNALFTSVSTVPNLLFVGAFDIKFYHCIHELAIIEVLIYISVSIRGYYVPFFFLEKVLFD